jgi:hypothetical protein
VAVTTTNLIMGPAALYTGAFGETEPAVTAEGIGAAPSSDDWTDVGGTTDGLSLKIAQEYKELEVDQIVDVPGRRLTKRDFSLETNMAEPTLENLSVALNGGTVTVGTSGAAGTTTYEPDDTTSATQPTYRALIVDGYSPDSNRRRVIVRKVLSTAGVETAYKKDDQTVFKVTFSAHYVSPSIKPFKIVDETPA